MTIVVSIDDQSMGLWNDKLEKYEKFYVISTSKNGSGEKKDSYCTPRGYVKVGQKIGDGEPLGRFFIGRKPVDPAMVADKTKGITTRILWLSGEMLGFNKGGDCDTKERMIYIHGVTMPSPLPPHISEGCINMTDEDVLDLFDRVDNDTPVAIYDQSLPKYYVRTRLGSLSEISNYFPNVSKSANWYLVASSTGKSSIVGYMAVSGQNVSQVGATSKESDSIVKQMSEFIQYYCIAQGYPKLRNIGRVQTSVLEDSPPESLRDGEKQFQ
ncbi:L,D-transpeptidase [Candidatus Ichthyocystis sparus]|uniref:L,D-transpeptidase n=1 Tax=Candidatus Ichthyocystis sparus TaxID=1561004 RepID=UPI000B849A3F|nr:L,D-transpeptidase [Candidatus Ichthyocystis sparus]